MKRVAILTILLISSLITAAQVTLDWAGSFTGSSNNETPAGIAIDKDGNIYTVGAYKGTLDFDPGLGVHNIPSQAGNWDIFITKLDSSGNLIWALRLGSSDEDKGQDILVTSNNELIITGTFKDTVDFDPGPGVFELIAQRGATVLDYEDIFILKLDFDGNFKWAKRIGGNYYEFVQSITEDISGNIYLTGHYVGSMDADPGPGSHMLYSAALDVFIIKLDSSNNFLWAHGIGGSMEDYNYQVVCDPSGNVFIRGMFNGTSDFDPGPGTATLTASYFQFYLLKLDSGGNFVWVRTLPINPFDNTIAADAAGNVLISGRFGGSVDIDPGPATYMLNSNGQYDVFLLRLDAAGNFISAISWGGIGPDYGYSIKQMNTGEIIIGGIFQDTVDFDPSPSSVFNLMSSGSYDAFIVSLSPSNQLNWAASFGGSGNERLYDLVFTSGGDVVSNGTFSAVADFDPGYTNYNLTASGSTDIFIQKIRECGVTNSTHNIIACGNYDFHGHIYDQSGTYTDTFSYALGCDSIVTLNIYVLPLDTTSYNLSSCDSVVWNGNVFHDSGVYEETYVNQAGCDSIVLLNVSILPADRVLTNVNSCGPYIWQGKIFDISGVYSESYSNRFGCDSTEILDLSIDTLDESVIQSANVLIASQSGIQYQWLDCNNNYAPVAGANSQVFTALLNGSYAVELVSNSCTDTSACYNVTNIGIHQLADHEVSVFPNPTSGQLNISFWQELPEWKAEITDISGRKLNTWNFTNTASAILDIPGAKGVYILHISVGDNILQVRVLKE